MPKVLEYGGNTYEVPDDFPDEQLVELVKGETSQAFPVISPEEQKQRDAIAAKLRGDEVGNDPKKIKSTISDIEEALKKRPMNADVRGILKRELSHWKTLQEQQSGN